MFGFRPPLGRRLAVRLTEASAMVSTKPIGDKKRKAPAGATKSPMKKKAAEPKEKKEYSKEKLPASAPPGMVVHEKLTR